MYRIDLHTHSTASDGIYSPEELVAFAEKNNVRVLALSDHDTVDGIDEALAASAGRNIKVIPALEFSIQYDGGTFHLLGMFIDHKNPVLLERLKYFADKRETRAVRMVEDLQKHGIDIPLEEVIAEAKGGVLGKPHVARVLVHRGYSPDVKSVFSSFLEKGKPGYVPKEKISFHEAMDLIRLSGGISVLAHPASLELEPEAMNRFISELKEAGLDGIEVFAEMHDAETRKFYLAAAEKNGLLVSGGSDFHGDKQEIIGFCRPDQPVPPELYEPLEKYRNRKFGK